ncbi:MAG: MFS transporter [Saprospiraceae bacterium]|nr:MFS transporter [Saprospiraceae bacterium]
MENQNKEKEVWFTVIVAALGYFVDIFDLQLFNVIGKQSLGPAGLNLAPEQVNYYYDFVLFNFQMGGMLIGGLLWGIMGDRLGRKSILFGSILMYSLANFANGFVTDTTTYSVLRFVAGFGLAGELGAAITLVSELMSKENRGIGTIIIVSMGALGAVASATISKNFSWQTSYFIGGGLGLMLLFLRFRTFESGMFENLKNTEGVSKGNFLSLFTSRERFVKYLWCILLGVPIWYTLGILIKFSPKIAEATGVLGKVSVADAVMYAYIGLSFGDLVCGWLSQVYSNRRHVVAGFLLLCMALSGAMLYVQGLSVSAFYIMSFLLGCVSGYWGLFVTIASEQFGTNVRATVTTTVPNFVRGSVILLTLAYKNFETQGGAIAGATWVGLVSFALAFVAIWQLKETFGKDLNYYENS